MIKLRYPMVRNKPSNWYIGILRILFVFFINLRAICFWFTRIHSLLGCLPRPYVYAQKMGTFGRICDPCRAPINDTDGFFDRFLLHNATKKSFSVKSCNLPGLFFASLRVLFFLFANLWYWISSFVCKFFILLLVY